MTDMIKEQIFAVRGTGLTNMFDVNAVQIIADEMELCELVLWLPEHRGEYSRFILYGED